jgi:hypothetical protein
MTGFMHFFLTVCDAYTCKLTKLRYYRYFFFDIDISIFFNITMNELICIGTSLVHWYTVVKIG